MYKTIKKVKPEEKKTFSLPTNQQDIIFLLAITILLVVLLKPMVIDGLSPQGVDVVAQVIGMVAEEVAFACLLLHLVPKTAEEVRDLVQADILQLYHEFYYCPHCVKVFWKGSHFKRMESYIRDLT